MESIQSVPIWAIVKFAIFAVGVLVFLFGSPVIVQQKQVGYIMRFGKMIRVVSVGLSFKWPIIESCHTISAAVSGLDVTVSTKTKDNVNITIEGTVQYRLIGTGFNDVEAMVFKMVDLLSQLTAFYRDVILSQIPTLTLDDLFTGKDTISKKVREDLEVLMKEYGLKIPAVLIKRIGLPKEVSDSMDQINATERLKVAAQNEGEAHKIKVVLLAEADRDSKKLNGEGVAQQRKAIAHGLSESLDEMKDTGVDQLTLLMILMTNLYLDTVRDASKNPTNTMLLPFSAGGAGNLMQDMMTAMMASKNFEKARADAKDKGASADGTDKSTGSGAGA